MSLINKMLQDLDARGGDGARGDAAPELRPVSYGARPGASPLLIGAGVLALAVLGGGGYAAYKHFAIGADAPGEARAAETISSDAARKRDERIAAARSAAEVPATATSVNPVNSAVPTSAPAANAAGAPHETPGGKPMRAAQNVGPADKTRMEQGGALLVDAQGAGAAGKPYAAQGSGAVGNAGAVPRGAAAGNAGAVLGGAAAGAGSDALAGADAAGERRGAKGGQAKASARPRVAEQRAHELTGAKQDKVMGVAVSDRKPSASGAAAGGDTRVGGAVPGRGAAAGPGAATGATAAVAAGGVGGEPGLNSQQKAENEYRRALTSLQDARVNEAIAGLEHAVYLYPRHDAARQTLVSLLIEAGRASDAIRHLTFATSLEPRQASMAMLLARLQLEHGGNALETLQRSLPYAESSADYRALLAGVLQRQNRHKEAAEQYQAAIRLQPGNAVWWMGMGISLQAEQRNAEAKIAFLRARDSGRLAPELQTFVERRLQQLN